MRLGAGLPVALAVASAAAGWGLLGGLVLAAALAACTPWTVAAGRAPRLLACTRAAARLGVLALCGTVFAAYLVPERPALAAAGFVAVVTAVAVAGLRTVPYRRWVAGALLVAAAAFVALCVAVPPAASPARAGLDARGVLLAGAVLFPLLSGLPRLRLAVGSVVAAAVAAAALYQLGPVRLGLSPTSLRDVLGAADAAALQPLLSAVVVLATATAGLAALGGAHAEGVPAIGPGRSGTTVALGLGAALAAAVLGPVGALLLAAALTLAGAAAAAGVVLRHERRAGATLATLATVLSVVLLAGLVSAGAQAIM
ncbi:hypothetical protein [Qaidamihabitans albus]|uniref:hypothetical protein n=1 Tax=Qaidamihabitans albus TaxID=2795733 RepID=UPI0018F16A7D|nr:hypothetical protein [Qaidamihabitans albus]